MSEATASEKPYQIVIGFDFSDLSERAVEEALEIARRWAPAELHVVTVARPEGLLVRLPGEADPITEDLARETVRLRIAQVVDEYQAHVGRLGIDRLAIYVLAGLPLGDPGKLITDVARAVDANLIVVGTHGRRGISRVVLGSVAQHVVREASTSVYVVRPADFVGGTRVPAIEPPLAPGEPHLRQFEHHRTYHYVDKVAPRTNRITPAS